LAEEKPIGWFPNALRIDAVACLICGAKDREVSYVAQFWVRKCERCGFYGLPEALAEEIREQTLTLNVERTKAFLSKRSDNQEPPWITAEDVENHHLMEA
jgi:hypothetical protein